MNNANYPTALNHTEPADTHKLPIVIPLVLKLNLIAQLTTQVNLINIVMETLVAS
jgi:hypothetical protein